MKKSTFLEVINKTIISKFFKDFTNHGMKANKAILFRCTFLSTFLNTGTTNETFQQPGKQDSLRYILKSPTSII